MKKCCFLLCLFLLAGLFAPPVCAQGETEMDEQTQQYYSDTLEQIRQLGEEAGLTGTVDTPVEELTVGTILESVFASFMQAIKSPFRLLLYLLAALIGMKLLSSFSGENGMSRIYATVSIVVVAVLILQPVLELIHRMIDLTDQVANFVYGFVPVFTGVVISTGQIVSGTTYSAILIGAAQVFSTLMNTTLMPFICAFTSFGIVGVLQPGLNLKSLQSTIKNGVSFCLVLLTTIFVGLFSLQNIVGQATDAQALKAAKLVFSSAIPIVGSAISDAVGTISGCLHILKTSAGAVGIGSLILIFAPTLIEAVALKFVLALSTIASDITGSSEVTGVLKTISSALSMLVAVLVCYLLILIVSTAVLMSVGS